MDTMKRLVGGLLGVLLLPQLVWADMSVRPFLIDVTLEPRESTIETIRLASTYDVRKAILFATVNEITVGEDGEVLEFVPPVMTDRTNSITSWIEIQRGRIEVAAGEQVDVPISIKVHPYATPGEYYAFIGMVETSKRYLAEEAAVRGDADGIVVKVIVPDTRTDTMRISSLAVDRFVMDTTAQQVVVTVENPGEITSSPTGELIFYNNRGTEIGATPVNTSGVSIEPGASKQFMVNVPADVSVGKYKANVNLRYGGDQRASLYDSTTFFFIPWWYQLLFVTALALLLLIFIVLYRRTTDQATATHHGDDVAMFVRDGHNKEAKDHDIDLKNL